MRPMLWALLFAIFSIPCGLSVVFSGQLFEMERSAGENFVKAYLEVDNVLMGGSGKSRELLQSMEYANACLKHDSFVETWSHILEMECIIPALDLRTKVKTPMENDFVQRYNDVCYKKFIFFHWNEVNGSIEKRYAQVRSPEFLEAARVRH